MGFFDNILILVFADLALIVLAFEFHFLIHALPLLDYYKKNPSAAVSLRGSIYEEKIINLIKEKTKITKKTISAKEAEKIIEEHHKSHHHIEDKETEKPKKTIKTSKKTKKIRKK